MAGKISKVLKEGNRLGFLERGLNMKPTVDVQTTGWVNVLDFGAVRDGSRLTTEAIQAAIDAAAAAGGGRVVIPAGKYLSGSIRLRSNIELYLDAGATLVGATDVKAFPLIQSRWEGPRVPPIHEALISGEDLENVTIRGRGTIDGNGAFWWDLVKKEQATEMGYRRPRLIRLVNCRNVLIEGLRLINSPAWTVNPTACENVVISRLTIQNPPDSPNTDGINPDSCSNVRISDCTVDVGDDCVTIKSGKEDDGRRELRPCENIVITNCTMLHGHGGVVIGSEMSGGVRNIAISNCVFVGTDRGIRIKTRRGRGNAVEDIRVSNIVMDGVFCPLVVNLFYGCGAWGQAKVTDRRPFPVDATTPAIRRLRFSNISARRIKYAAGFFLGLPERYLEDIVVSDCSLWLDPENQEGGAPAMAPGVDNYCRAGFCIEFADGVVLRNVDIHHQLGPAVCVKNARNIRVCALRAGAEGGELVAMENVEGAAVEG